MAVLRALVQPTGTRGTKTEQKTPVLAKSGRCRSHTRLSRLQVQQIDLLVHKGKKGRFPTKLFLFTTLQALHLAIYGPFSKPVQLTNPQGNQTLLFAESVLVGLQVKQRKATGWGPRRKKTFLNHCKSPLLQPMDFKYSIWLLLKLKSQQLPPSPRPGWELSDNCFLWALSRLAWGLHCSLGTHPHPYGAQEKPHMLRAGTRRS